MGASANAVSGEKGLSVVSPIELERQWALWDYERHSGVIEIFPIGYVKNGSKFIESCAQVTNLG
ncbi:MAG: hypothetical protein HOH33_10730 [Verrucomicrobia bacterium]|nr:hypothetical protein [Verrucomicrobiota bacterium]